MKLIDITHTISHGMPVFPGETEPSIVRDSLPDDIGYVTHRLETNMHTGTHMDAPFHVKSGSLTIDKFPVQMFTGSAVVIDVRGLQRITMQVGWEQFFRKYEIVLFCTGHSQAWKTESYYYDYPEFDSEIAQALVDSGVRIAGFDSPSPDKTPYNFHSIFLKDERFLVENLANLEKLIGKENITVMAFPLKIEAEASLIRAVAMIED
ncbi:MAG: cyclase family protein [Lentimicrobiaceae bacterium]|jgi:kynurenine formamidase